MNYKTSRSATRRWLLGPALAFLTLSLTGCALLSGKPEADVQWRERVVTVPKLFLQPLEVEPLQGQTNEDLERQRNDALRKVKEANERLEKIGRWSDGESGKDKAPAPEKQSAPAAPSRYEALKASMKSYATKGEQGK